MLTPDNLLSFLQGIRAARKPDDLWQLGIKYRTITGEFALDTLANFVGLAACALKANPLNLMHGLTGQTTLDRYVESEGLEVVARLTLEIITDPAETARVRATIAAKDAEKQKAH